MTVMTGVRDDDGDNDVRRQLLEDLKQREANLAQQGADDDDG